MVRLRSLSASLGLTGLLAWAGCDDGPVPCTPGRQVGCVCADGSTGLQLCNDDGEYDSCSCGYDDGYDGDDGSSSPPPSVPEPSYPDDPDDLWPWPPSTVPDAGVDAGPQVIGECSGRALAYRPVDVEYSSSLDRIVTIAANPNRVMIQDPHSEAVTEVALPLPGTALSIAPDGKTAAVSHNAYLSVVDLALGTLTETIQTSTDSIDVVLADSGWAYVFPKGDSSAGLHSVELATKTDHGATAYSGHSGIKGRLHPAGSTIYGISRYSSGTLVSYDVSAGVAMPATSSAYDSQHPACDALWFSEPGDRIFTGCGTTFRASPGTADDATYAGMLGGESGRFKWVVHSGAKARVYGIPTRSGYSSFPFDEQDAAHEERQIRVYTADFLALETSLDIPCLQTGATKQAVYGRHVFASPAGDALYVLGQLAASTGAANDWTYVKLEL